MNKMNLPPPFGLPLPAPTLVVYDVIMTSPLIVTNYS